MRKIDDLNNQFLTIIEKDTKATRNINKAIINGKTAKEAVEENDTNANRDATYYYLIAVLSIMLTRTLTIKEKVAYAPIIALTSMYSTKDPKRFTKKVDKIFKGSLLTHREKSAKKLLNGFIKKGKAVIDKIQRKIIDVRIKSKSEIYKDVKRLQGKTYAESKKELLKKYNDPKRVRRAIRTEAHAELERGKLMQGDEFGYTHKTWKTRNDSRVRQTPWHNAIKNKRVPIDSDFRATGLRAQYPGDTRLPIGERINCRCFLIMD